MTKGEYLGEFELVVLLALARLDEAAYGMSIYDEIVATTGREVSIQAVYVTLNRLEKKGYVTSKVGGPAEDRGGRSRKYYTILPSGLSALTLSRTMYDSLWAGVRLKPRTTRP
ncbi:MAG: PadR family transcriptional regulator [Gemmatimonadota bacterium]|nr:MAG: PadR family transcriptional regulator [Gemmatimonadota bacterium]